MDFPRGFFWALCRGFVKGWFRKGWFWRMFLDPPKGNEVTKAGVPGPRELERGYKERNDSTKNRNKGTFTKTALLQNRPFVSSRLCSNCCKRRERKMTKQPCFTSSQVEPPSRRSVQYWVGAENEGAEWIPVCSS